MDDNFDLSYAEQLRLKELERQEAEERDEEMRVNRMLQQQQQTAPDEKVEKDEPEEDHSVGDYASDFLTQVAEGFFDAVGNTGQTVVDLGGLIDSGLEVREALPDLGEAETGLGSVAHAATQFAVGFVPAARAVRVLGGSIKAFQGLKAAGLGGAALKPLQKGVGAATGRYASASAGAQNAIRGAAAGGIGDFFVYDPHEERLANLAQDFGIEGPITDYLAADEDDSDAEGRLKNVLEGLLIGGAVDTTLETVRFLRGWRRKFADINTRAGSPVTAEDVALIKTRGERLAFLRRYSRDLETVGNMVRETDEVAEGPIQEARNYFRGVQLGGDRDIMKDRLSGEARAFVEAAEYEAGVENIGISDNYQRLVDAFEKRVAAAEAAEVRISTLGHLDGHGSQVRKAVTQFAGDQGALQREAAEVADSLDQAEDLWDEALHSPAWDRMPAEDRVDIQKLVDGSGKIKAEKKAALEQAREAAERSADEVREEVVEAAQNADAPTLVRLFEATQSKARGLGRFVGKEMDEFEDVVLSGDLSRFSEALDAKGIDPDINFAYLETEDDWKEIFATALEFFDGTKISARAYSGTAPQTIESIRQSGLDLISADIKGIGRTVTPGAVEGMERMLDELIPATADLPQKVLALRFMEMSMLDHMQKLGHKIRTGGALQRDFAEYSIAVRRFAYFNDARSGIVSNIGRALRQQQISASALPADLSRMVDDVIVSSGGHDEIVKLVHRMDDAMGDREALSKIAGKHFGHRTLSAVAEYWLNALLSGPVTQTVNIVSNAAVGMWNPIEVMAQGVIHADDEVFSEGIKMLRGYVEGWKAAFRLSARAQMLPHKVGTRLAKGQLTSARAAFSEVEPEEVGTVWRTLTTGENVTVPEVHLREGPENVISGETFAPELDRLRGVVGDRAAGYAARMIDAFGGVVNLPSRFLATGDELAKTINYQMELSRLAYRDARAVGKVGRALDEHMERVIREAPYHDTFKGLPIEQMQAYRTIDSQAKAAARRLTFTESIDATTITSKIQSLAYQHPTARFFVPFIRTPSNILKYTFQRTPGVARLSREYNNVMRFGSTLEKQAMRSRLFLGTGLWMTGVHLAAGGRITGGGPQNSDERAALLATGWQPYSVRWTDSAGKTRYTAFNRLDPIGMFFGIAADFSEITGEMETQDLEETATAMVVALMSNLKSKSYLQGVTMAIDALNHPDQKFEVWKNRMAGSFVPNFFAQTKRTGVLPGQDGDPTLHEIDGMLDSMRSRMWGFGKDLPPRRNIYGEPVTYPMGLGWDTVSPFFTRTETQDPVALEVARLRIPFNMRQMFDRIDGVELTPKQKDELIRLSSQDLSRTGRSLKDALHDLITSERYRDRLGDGTDDFEGGRSGAIKRLMRRYRERGRKELLRRHPDLKESVMEKRRSRRLARTSEGTNQLLAGLGLLNAQPDDL